MSNPISGHVELQVKSGQLDALRALTSEMVESTKSEIGALIYERFVSEDSQVVHVIERYIDSPAAIAPPDRVQENVRRTIGEMVDRRRFTVFGTPTPELRKTLDPLVLNMLPLLPAFRESSSAGQTANAALFQPGDGYPAVESDALPVLRAYALAPHRER